MRPSVRTFLVVGIPVLVADRITKVFAYSSLQPAGIPHEVVGQVARFTLVYNRDAAMNLTLGSWSRWGFATIAVIGVMVVLRLLRNTAPAAHAEATALALIAAGAVGNLIDRLRWDRGVIDFIDLGIGRHRFWTFNVADIGVTTGAVLLLLVYSRQHPRERSVTDI